MKFLKSANVWGLVLALALFGACEESEEYPDENFTIVGTWRYHVPALTGSAPREGYVYNADGRITFTADMRFCFTLYTDCGEVKGCGSYKYNEDTGIDLVYDGYTPVAERAVELGVYDLVPFVDEVGAIGWGWGESMGGDIVRDDYLKVHTTPVPEYFRITDTTYEDAVQPYRPEGSDVCYYVTHDGESLFHVPSDM